MIRRNVILVEDNSDHAELVLRNIDQFVPRETVRHFSDGESAAEFFEKDCSHGVKPGLVILDLRLPKVDGIDILKQIKKCSGTNDIPVVVLTTSDSESDIKKAYELCANAYIVKPESFEAYEDMIKGMGNFWLGYNRTVS